MTARVLTTKKCGSTES